MSSGRQVYSVIYYTLEQVSHHSSEDIEIQVYAVVVSHTLVQIKYINSIIGLDI